jgi:N6-adenosine-specific RNA methylase IME4
MAKTKITIPFPIDKKYNIILNDPGWNFRDKCASGKRGSSFKYGCMKTDDICKLPVPDIMMPDCYMFLWCPSSMLKDGIKVIEAYGMTYKTIVFAWLKRGKSGKLFWGMGSYSRQNLEVCLLGVKGRLKRQSASVHQIIESPRREHSRKPDETRDRIVKLYGDVPKIELFAREKTKNWNAWGLALLDSQNGEFVNK